MPTIRIPIPLRQHTGNQGSVQVQGSTVGEALDDLFGKYPALQEKLYDDGDLVTTTYESINILLGLRDIRELQGRDTPLGDSDRLMILRTWPAAISGGRQWNQPVGTQAPA